MFKFYPDPNLIPKMSYLIFPIDHFGQFSSWNSSVALCVELTEYLDIFRYFHSRGFLYPPPPSPNPPQKVSETISILLVTV